MIRDRIIRAIRACGGVQLVVGLNRAIRGLSSWTHRVQFALQWGAKPVPAWFDHYLDLHYLWKVTRTPTSVERGIFGLLAIKHGARVLELCCGDGFNTFHFYSIRASKVVSVDIDRDAIASAKRTFAAPNVEYLARDIRSELPEEAFDNVIWDASLEYFTADELQSLLRQVKKRMAPDGVLSGFSIVQATLAEEHRQIFESRKQLEDLLDSHFRNVHIVETVYPNRISLYFYAGDGSLPVRVAAVR